MNEKTLPATDQQPQPDSSEILIASPEDEARRDFRPLQPRERVTLGFDQLRDAWRQLRAKH